MSQDDHRISSALRQQRPSPGPGFAARMTAGALQQSVVLKRRRVVTRVMGGAAGGLAIAALAVVMTIGPGNDGTESAEAPATEVEANSEVRSQGETPVGEGESGELESAPAGAAAGPQVVDASLGQLPTRTAISALTSLSQNTQRRIFDALDEAKKVKLRMGAAIEIEEIDLRRELAKASPNRATVNAHLMRIAMLESHQRSARVRAWLGIRNLLSSRQLQALVKSSTGSSAKRRSSRDRSAHGDVLANPFAPSPARSNQGTLAISSKPIAKVWVNGKAWGTSPFYRTVPAGKHRVTLRVGSKVARKVVVVRAGKSVKIVHDFTRKSKQLNPWGETKTDPKDASPQFMGPKKKSKPIGNPYGLE